MTATQSYVVSHANTTYLMQTLTRLSDLLKRQTEASVNFPEGNMVVHRGRTGEVENSGDSGRFSASAQNRMSPGKARSPSHDEEQTPKRPKFEESPMPNVDFILIESVSLKECRRRTYSHWSEKFTEFKELLIDAGFLGCNVGDRTICIYCNVICQQWDIENDDPQEFHRSVSPRCAYLPLMPKSIDMRREQVTDADMTNAEVRHVDFCDAASRKQSFETKNDVTGERLNELVDGGFFYSADTCQVKCFHCGERFLDWKTVDSVRVAHVKMSPHCAAAKAHCGANLHQRIIRDMHLPTSTRKPIARGPNLAHIIDESQLSRFVAARLDLPVSQDLLNRNYRLSVIKRVWEDQLRLKHDDFVEDTDIYIACQILQKQIEIINGNKDNIIIPKVKMEQLRRQETEVQETTEDAVMTAEPAPAPAPAPAPEPTVAEQKVPMPTKAEKEEVPADVAVEHPCLVCKKAEKQLACIPCGHLTACVACGQTIRTCPTCRKDIDAYVRVYM